MSYELIDLDFGERIGYEGQSELYVCPQCSHTLHVTKSLGLLNCFYCGFGKGLRLKNYFRKDSTPLKEYNQNIPEFSQKLSEILKLSKQDRSYLISRGIKNPENFGLLSTPSDIKERLISYFGIDWLVAKNIFPESQILPYALHPDRIIIPYSTTFNGIVSIKSRSTPYKEIMSPGCLRYTTLQGSRHSQYLYKPTKLIKNSTLIITEGEFKAIVGSQFGYNVVAIPGISFTRGAYQEARTLSKHFKYNYIVLDNDKAFEETKGPVKAYLRLLEIPNTIPIILPKTSNQKVGLDDYLLSHSEDFQDLLDEGFWRRKDTLSYLKDLEQSIKPNESSLPRNI